MPIGLALLLAGARLLPRDLRDGRPAPGLDLPGLTTLAAAVTLLVVPLVLGHEQGWPGWIWPSATSVNARVGEVQFRYTHVWLSATLGTRLTAYIPAADETRLAIERLTALSTASDPSKPPVWLGV